MMKVPYTGTIPSWIPLDDDDRDERQNIFNFHNNYSNWYSSDINRYIYIDKYGNQTSFSGSAEHKCRKLNLAPGQPFRAIIKPPQSYRCSYEYDEWDTDYYIEYTHQAEWSEAQKEKAWRQWLLARRNYAARDLTIMRRIEYIQKHHLEYVTINEDVKSDYGEKKSQIYTWTLRSSYVKPYGKERFESRPFLQNQIYMYESKKKEEGHYTDEDLPVLRQEAIENITKWLITNTSLSYKTIIKFIRKPIVVVRR